MVMLLKQHVRFGNRNPVVSRLVIGRSGQTEKNRFPSHNVQSIMKRYSNKRPE